MFNPEEQAVAIYLNKRNNKRTAIMPTRYGGFWEYRLDYEGMFAWGATADFPDYIARMVEAEDREGQIQWLKTPQTPYHCWHLCFCPECRGKVWSHSQGDWDAHLRYVDNKSVVTYGVAK